MPKQPQSQAMPTDNTPNPTLPPLSQADTQSANVMEGNLTQLKTLFPEAFKEGGIDFEVLKQLLGGQVDEREEKYGLNWHGKRRARQIALTPSTGTLRPCPGESVDWDTTQNLMIEGDNLEVLKLLQKSYAGKVKMIYIDPPYNTGKDFVYPDNFTDNIKNYLELTGQTDGEGRKLSSNTEASGRFHTDWLNMMYPRLKLAKNLLPQEGVVFISCNDKEVSRLLAVMDEIFGEENFVSQIVWQRSKKGDAKLIAQVHEYILCYVKDKAAVIEQGIWRKPKEGAEAVLSKYLELKNALANKHDSIRTAMMDWYRQLADDDARKAHKHYNWSDDRGLYFADNFAGPDDGRESRPRHEIIHPVTRKACKKPSTGWRWDEEKTNWALAQTPIRIHFGEDETTIPNRKSYLAEIDSEPYSSVFYRDGRSATLEVEELVGEGWFQFPKNTEVLAELIELVTKPEDVVLDFFAGSGSTAHAVMKVNALHASKRRFLMVQLPEPVGKEPYSTIADITKERLRRAATKIRAAHASSVGSNSQLSLETEPQVPRQPLDLGFKVFKLDTSNIRAWNPNPDELADTLMAHTEHLATGRTEADVLYEVLLKQGLDLAVPVQRQVIAGHTVHSVGAGALLVCLAGDVTGQGGTSTSSVRTGDVMAESSVTAANAEALALGIADWHTQLATALGQTPAELHTRVVLRDSLFDGDVAKTNLTAILRQRGLEDVRSL
jgi:adenine-specific DNA-methyltransferase